MALGMTVSGTGIPVNTFIGSLVNTMIRDNIKVIRTSCLNETICYLLDIYKKLICNNHFYMYQNL